MGTTDLMNKQTIGSMCMAYEDAQKDVREGIRLLAQAKKRLANTIGDLNGSVISTPWLESISTGPVSGV